MEEQLDLEVFALKKRLKELRSTMGEHPPERLVQEELTLETRLSQVRESINPLKAENITVLLQPVQSGIQYTYFRQNPNGATLIGSMYFNTSPRGQVKMFEWAVQTEKEERQGIARSRDEARNAAYLELIDLLK